MANPQRENGHLRIANELIEAFQWLHLSGNQWRLLWTILRFTYGWNKKVDHISLTTFEKCTGLNRWNLKRDLNDLLHRGIIIKDSSDYITKYGLQKDHTKWQTSIKNNTSIKNDTATSIKNDTKTSIKNDTHKRQKTIKDIYSENSIEFHLSKLLFDLILLRNPNHRKPDLQKWCVHVHRMLYADKRERGEVEAVIRWCQSNNFWQNIILSTEKLRKQFDQLKLKMDHENPKRFDE